MRVLISVLLLFLGALSLGESSSPAAKERLELDRVGNFNSPLYLTQAPSGPLAVVEQGGKIKVKRGSKWAIYLNLRREVGAGGEQGLLGLAFHPNYQKNRRFYVNYTDQSGDTKIVEYKRSKSSAYKADESSRRELLSINQPADNHNGGHLEFDRRGYLYIATGDGGGGGDPSNNAQNKKSLLGKILRVDPVGKQLAPRSNPFVGKRGSDLVFSYGLRNPWRFSISEGRRAKMFIGDVGQERFEEINYLPLGRAKGANFGWSRFEGYSVYNSDRRAKDAKKPIHVYQHSDFGGSCSVTGGYLAKRGSGLSPGRYYYGDFCSGKIRSLVPGKKRARGDRATGLEVSSLASFGEDQRGRIYAVSLSGHVYRLEKR